MQHYSDENHRVIASLIDDGTYFQDAYRWYERVYVSPLSERAHALLLTVLCCVVSLFMAITLLGLFPITATEVVALRMEDMDSKLPRLKALGQGNEDADTSLMRFFVQEYVRNRELYEPENIGMRAKRLHSMSDHDTYYDYRLSLDPSSPQSPLVRYERHSVRNIALQETNLLESSSQTTPEGSRIYKALVRYVARVDDGQEQQDSRWEAEVTFSYRNVVVNQETGEVTPMDFTVTEYTTHQLQQDQEG
jgi:type IV secretory pathway component VirB8